MNPDALPPTDRLPPLTPGKENAAEQPTAMADKAGTGPDEDSLSPVTEPAPSGPTPNHDSQGNDLVEIGTFPTEAFPDIPGFTILKELGRGGMGVVYKAKQSGLDRTVALKMILKADFATPEQKLRFQIEAENAARVQHPNIVQVFEIGNYKGQPFFAQEFVDGGSLADWLKSQRMKPGEAAAFVEKLARAIFAAHSQGIIHRDLKPGNILLGEPPASADGFSPKITDFGLAKRLDQTADLTGSHAVLGTPNYMSPEQAQGMTRYVGPPADQYSLGVILYQLLTGDVPFRGDSLSELLAKIVEEVPRSPRQINPEVPLDLAVICLKCLEKDPARRYDSTEALADDLRNWREHRPITARPATRLERVMKWRRRYPAVAALIAVSVLAALLASGLAWWALRAEGVAKENERLAEDRLVQVEAEKKKVEEEKRIATAVNDFLQYKLLAQGDPRQQANRLLQLGQREQFRDPDPKLSLLLARAAAELAPDKIEANFPKQPLLQAELLQTVGNTYAAIGGKDNDQYALAIDFLQRAAQLRKEHLGAEDPHTLLTLHLLALAYQNAGRPPEAIRLLEQVRDARVLKLGADHPETLTTLNNLASAYQSAGRLPEAIRVFEQVRDAQVHPLGADHPKTLITLNNLAMAYHAAGRVPEAIRVFEQVRDTLVAKLGANHPDTLISLNNLAGAYFYASRLSEAIPLLEQVHGTRVSLLGPDHPETLNTVNNLAAAYHAAGRLPEAIRLLEQVRDAMVTKLGVDHPETLATLNNLAGAYQAAGRLPEALPLFEQAARSIERLRFQHEYSGPILAASTHAHEEARKFDKAEAWRRKWLAHLKGQAGAESPAYTRELAALGRNLLLQEKWGEAETALRECLAIRMKTQPDDWTTFNTMSMLGGALLGRSKSATDHAEKAKLLAEAEPLLLKGYEGIKTRLPGSPGADAPRLAMKLRLTEALDRLIDLYTALEKPDEVKKWQAEKGKLK